MNSTLRPHVSIQANALVASYRDHVALRAPNVEVSGNVIAVIGHNGAGKSTFMKLILDLLPLREGRLAVYEQTDSARLLEPAKHMSFCPEEGAVFADISVESYIQLWCRVKQRDPAYYKKAGSRYIELLNISPLMNRLGRELSKGQRRRVQTAIGFLGNPRFFLVDEPFDGLDVQKTSDLARIVKEESAAMSFLISSHRMDVVERIADTVVVLQDGEFIACGSVEAVCRKLCPTSVIVESVEDPQATAQHIRQALESCFVSVVGSNIRILGNGYSSEQLAGVLDRQRIKPAQYHQASADLVDAMNFHLRDLDR